MHLCQTSALATAAALSIHEATSESSQSGCLSELPAAMSVMHCCFVAVDVLEEAQLWPAIWLHCAVT